MNSNPGRTLDAVDQYNNATGKTTFCMDNLEGASLLDEGITFHGDTCRKHTGNSHLEHASPLMGIVDQGLASPTQPAESKEDINLNLDYSNTLPVVATDASIKGTSSELNSESDDADTVPAWWVAYQQYDGRYECRICLIDSSKMKLYSEESFVSHFMEEHANSAEWMDDVDIRC